MAVVLPAPLGPTNPNIWPSAGRAMTPAMIDTSSV
jgi:hypothetical protein